MSVDKLNWTENGQTDRHFFVTFSGISSPSYGARISGLFLIKPIDMDKSFKPSEELKRYMEYARDFEAKMLEKRKQAIAQLNWEQT